MDLDYHYDHSPFDRLLGLRLEEASEDRVVGVVPVTADLHQNGIVHPGVYSTAVEATPIARGRDTQLWQVAITDERDRLVAHGRVLLMNLRKGPKNGEGGVS